MIRHLAILRADRSTLVATHAKSDLLAAIGCSRISDRSAISIGHARGEDPQCQIAILMLRSLRLAAHFDPRRSMTRTYGRVRLVPVLAARTRSAHGLDVDVLWTNRQISAAWLFKRRHSDRACLHAPTLLGRRHTLPTVASALGGEQR